MSNNFIAAENCFKIISIMASHLRLHISFVCPMEGSLSRCLNICGHWNIVLKRYTNSDLQSKHQYQISLKADTANMWIMGDVSQIPINAKFQNEPFATMPTADDHLIHVEESIMTKPELRRIRGVGGFVCMAAEEYLKRKGTAFRKG